MIFVSIIKLFLKRFYKFVLKMPWILGMLNYVSEKMSLNPEFQIFKFTTVVVIFQIKYFEEIFIFTLLYLK